MKKLCFVIIMTVLLSLIFAGCAFGATDNLSNAENNLATLNETELSTATVPAAVKEDEQIIPPPANASGVDSGLTSLSSITNLVIFICFSDDTISEVRESISVDIINMFNADDNSLKDYYQNLSYGSLTINSIFPTINGDYYIYKDTRTRSYYANISDNSRASAEAALLNAAVDSADEFFDYTSRNIDGNNDGFVDMVSFVINGQQTDWGGLLWPHSWSLNSISGLIGAKKLNNIRVNEFSFTFLQGYKIGYVCHETGHILGMPDLYHYDNDKDRYPAWEWDLMHYNNNTPQYVTTYMRNKYLNFTNENQIGNMVKSGTYTLSPTTITSTEEILAYKIEINEYESIWIEYRNNNVSTYDSELPGSGLVVYRINNKVIGNTEGIYQSTLHPDELYVFRPSIPLGNELTNISHAYVSPYNQHFSQIGQPSSVTQSYNQSAIYLTSGTNTGIIITPTVQTDLSITFTVDLASYDRSEISEIIVTDTNYQMYYGETPLPKVKIKYQGSSIYLTPLYSKLTFLYNSELIGTQTATVTYSDSENTLSTTFPLTIKDKVAVDGVEVTSLPNKTEYDINETINLTGLIFTITTISSAVEEKIYSFASDADWTIEGVDTTKSGYYSAKITYIPLNVFAHIEIRIMSGLEGIIVLQKDTMPIVRDSNLLKINVKGINADGTYRELERYEYRVSSYDQSSYFVPQILTITYTQNEQYTCQTTVYVVTGTLVRINVTKPTITQYDYGAKLNLEGGVLRFEYEGNESVSIPMSSFYTSFNTVYTPNKVGEQSLSIKVEGVTCTFVVKVMSQSSSLLSIAENEKDNIFISGSTIYLKKEYTIKDLESSFMSYLNIYFIYDNELYVNSNTYPNMLAGNKIRLQLNNVDLLITSYSIVLLGDTNGDGLLNNDDIPGMIIALMEERTTLLYLDINNDGAYTLTDFVLWVALLEENQ